MIDTEWDDELIRWEDVGSVDEWEAGSGRLVQIGARRIGVYRYDDRWFALKDLCPHQGISLVQGTVTDGTVTCVGHGWRFDLRTGTVVSGSCDHRVATYPVRVYDGRVEVGV